MVGNTLKGSHSAQTHITHMHLHLATHIHTTPPHIMHHSHLTHTYTHTPHTSHTLTRHHTPHTLHTHAHTTHTPHTHTPHTLCISTSCTAFVLSDTSSLKISSNISMATGSNYRMREKSENNFMVVCQEEQQENRDGIVFYMLPSNRPTSRSSRATGLSAAKSLPSCSISSLSCSAQE